MAKKVLSIIIITILQILVFTTIVRAKTVEITTETLNMRKEPSTESDIVALMSVGDECEVLSDEGDWYKVKYGEYTGYISKEYTKTVGEEDNGDEEDKEPQNEVSENTVSQNTIDEENEEDTTSEEQTNTVISETNDQNEQDSVVILKADTDGRITPLINGRIIEKLKKGTEVTIINELNSWVYIQTDTTSCWIRKDEISTKTSNNSSKDDSKKEDEKTESEKKDDNKETEFEKKIMYVKEEYVNIRKEPSTESELVMTVERNTEIDVIGETGDWYKVETSQGEAYISKELLTDKKVINTDGIVDVQKLTGQTLDRGNGTDGVTDVYKIELNEETSEYTLKYCVKVGEEESIWNVTEEVNSNVKELTIYLEEPTTIQYEEGMTWGEWLESKYNITTLYKNDDGRIFYNEGKACFIYSNEEEDIDIRDVIYSQIINPQYVYGIASVPQ